MYLLDREDASLDSLSANTFTEGMDVFPDTALPDPQDTTLSFNEESTLGEPSSFSDSDPLLIPACNDGNDLMSLSEIRRREEGVCDTKDPALDGLKVPGFSDIFKKLLPNIWQQQDDQDVIPRENGNIKKCKEPWIWNLCCNVCLSIPTSNPELGFFYDEFGACYVSMFFEVLLLSIGSFNIYIIVRCGNGSL